MDPKKLSHFVARYRAMDGDELVELHGKRENLAAEAVAALDTVFAEKGINQDILARYATAAPVKEYAAEENLARELYKSKLAMTSKLVFMMAAWSPVQYALNQAGVLLGALWAGLSAVLLGYAGYRFGNMVTRSICANAETTYAQKKRSLWVLLLVAVIVYFLLFIIVGALVSSRRA